MQPLFWYVLVLVLPVLLAVSGVVLANRYRTVATVIVASGFCAGLISTIAAVFLSAEISTQYLAGGDLAIVTMRWEGWRWLTHYLGIGGTWVGASGLLWHAFQIKPRLSRENQSAAKIE